MPSKTSSTAQAEREKPSRIELNVLVHPLAAHLPLVLAESEGQPQVSNEHRAMLREIPTDELATVIVRAVIGLLWRWRADEEFSAREVRIQDAGRAVGLHVLRALLRARQPDLHGAERDIALETVLGDVTLRRQTEIGFYLTNALHVAVPGLLQLQPPRRVFTNRGPRNLPYGLTLSSDAPTRFGFPTLLVACDRRPMIETPLRWGLQRGGYKYSLKGSVPLITNVSAREADPDCPQVTYDALNALQETPWRVNRGVLSVASALKGLLLPEEQDTVEEAEQEASQQVLYFVHSLDFRGRVYAHGTRLFPGGPDLARALLTFAHGRVVTAHDTRAIAALDGYGKECLGKALDPAAVMHVAREPLRTLSLWLEASDPWQFLAYCLERTALNDAHAAGKSWMSTLPVWQDASSNGLQHMAFLCRDESLAKTVNVAPSNERGDIYAEVAEKMTGRLREKATRPLSEARCKECVKKTRRCKQCAARRKIEARIKRHAQPLLDRCEGRIQRNHAKHPTMTLPYGAESYGFLSHFAEEVLKVKRDRRTGRYPNEANYLAECFAVVAWEALQAVVPKAVELLKWFQSIGKAIAQTKQPAAWFVPGTDFPAGQRHSFKPKTARLRLNWDDGTTQERWVTVPVQESLTLDASNHRTSLAPNVIHSLDAAHLMLTVTQARAINSDTPLGTIHDSFATCATDAPGLEQVFKSGFHHIYWYDGRNPLIDLASQFAAQCPEGQFPDLPEQGEVAAVSQVYAASPLR